MIVTVGRKPFKNSVCENITLHNTGGINIDSCRVGSNTTEQNQGRFPANIVFSERVTNHLPKANGAGHWAKAKITGYGKRIGEGTVEYFGVGEKDNSGGSVSKFFFIVKEAK